MKQPLEHRPEYPSARKIRRSCENELYRTIKRLKLWVSPDKMEQANNVYYRKVLQNSTWLFENRSNRKKQVDWWEENCCAELAAILEIDQAAFAKAFRAAYGG